MCVRWIAIEMLIFLLNPVDSYITAFWEMCDAFIWENREKGFMKINIFL